METQHRRPIMEMLRRYWMLPYQASGISGKSPEDGGGDEEDESGGGVAAGETLRCIANLKATQKLLQFLFRFNEGRIGDLGFELWD